MGGVPIRQSRAPAKRANRLVIVAAVLLVAIFVVVAVIVFSPASPDLDGQRRLAEWLAEVHRTWMPWWITFDLVEFASNVVMFLPLGLLGAIVFARARLAVLCACIAFSALVELVQWVLLPARQADWRDVAANSIGAALGVALAAAVTHIYRRRAVRPVPWGE